MKRTSTSKLTSYPPYLSSLGGGCCKIACCCSRGKAGEQVSLRLAVFGMAGDHVDQSRTQGGVVAVVVAVADIHTDPEKGSAGEEVVPVVGWGGEAPASSFVPSLGSTCPNLDWVAEGR
jgi:hypothetical protein